MELNKIFYGDNLDILRKSVKNESIDLCYIDPPFNSNRNYNQIYNNTGTGKDYAQSQAFIDTWQWDDASEKGLKEIKENKDQRITIQNMYLFTGLEKCLGKGSLLAYLVSMTLRIAEIHRALKSTGSFYLHCDPTASHYLKIICDNIFCPSGGDFKNEIIWKRYAVHSLSSRQFDTISDIILFYTKNINPKIFNVQYQNQTEDIIKKKFPHFEDETKRWFQHASLEKNSNKSSRNQIRIIDGKEVKTELGWVWTQETFDERLEQNPHLIYWTQNGRPRYKIYLDEYKGMPVGNIWTDIPYLSTGDKERLGYPTQKPEALLERIINASSEEGDVILDAYCGCGTTIAVAQKLNRKWIGIDISYRSISLIIKRLEESFPVLEGLIIPAGIPKDFDSAVALANKKDDRLRKEFEKWAVLTYSKNRAIINEKKGGDGGIDGAAFIIDRDNKNDIITKEVLFSVKSNKNLSPSVIRDLNGTLDRENAACGVFISLYDMPNLEKECKKYGTYLNALTQKEYPKIQIVTINELIDGKRFELPFAQETTKSSEKISKIYKTKELFEQEFD